MLDEKRDLIRKTAALTFTPPIPLDQVGGYQPVRRLAAPRCANVFARGRASLASRKPRAYCWSACQAVARISSPERHRPSSAGHCCSSTSARSWARVAACSGRPSSASSARCRSPPLRSACLRLSEYEKAVGGMRSSARTDGGATEPRGGLVAELAGRAASRRVRDRDRK